MSNTFCPLPWVNLNSNTEGSIKLCCNIQENFHIRNNKRELNFGIDSIEDIWHGNYMAFHRQQFLEGKKPDTCSVCWNLEKDNIQSPRQVACNEYKDINVDTVSLPTSLELRFGNHCNLQCNSCWSLSSDKIAKERSDLIDQGQLPDWLNRVWQGEKALVKNADFEWYKKDEFKKTFKKLAPTLKKIYLTGGEPTLIDENIEILQTLLDAGNKHCYIALTTNLTHWNEEFYRRLNYFHNAEIQISIDGIGEKNSYIRYPSNWNHIENNLQRLRNEIQQHFIIKHYTVYSVFNYDSIKEIIDWAYEKHDPPRRYIWSPIICYAPSWLNITWLPKYMREEALLCLEELNKNVYKDNIKKNAWFVHGIESVKTYLKETLTTPISRNNQDMFFTAMNVLDKKRNIDLQKVFPDLACLNN